MVNEIKINSYKDLNGCFVRVKFKNNPYLVSGDFFKGERKNNYYLMINGIKMSLIFDNIEYITHPTGLIYTLKNE